MRRNKLQDTSATNPSLIYRTCISACVKALPTGASDLDSLIRFRNGLGQNLQMGWRKQVLPLKKLNPFTACLVPTGVERGPNVATSVPSTEPCMPWRARNRRPSAGPKSLEP